MNVLAISGTMRKDGNSEILVERALKPFKEKCWNIRHIKLHEVNISSCTGCEACKIKLKRCIINDDMNKVYDAYEWCDAIIVSSPVYYRNINSKLMALLERHYAVFNENILTGKVGGAITVGRGAGRASTLSNIYTWMLSCGIICVPGELNGVTATASQPGDILNNEVNLKQAEILGGNILKITEKLRGI